MFTTIILQYILLIINFKHYFLIIHNFKEIFEFHEKNGYEATIVTSIKNFEIPYGVCETKNNGTLKNFMEKHPSF